MICVALSPGYEDLEHGVCPQTFRGLWNHGFQILGVSPLMDFNGFLIDFNGF